ncbi:General negative regulator of transcription subunit [Lachnellula subtilissima]|uniref:General negative regulator of transcription subunit 1 n=1 Tax=Lachnellula subtilissima TaxID=602034 RepID=A0A8H8U781_9HELO|nr:General negative regulator of transcription subunit [Lachnellula subtilissima]
MVTSRGGSFTPSLAQQQQHQQQPQSIVTAGVTHSPQGSHHGPLSAGASPSINSPTGANQVTKIVVAQVSLLLGSLKEDKDRNPKWEQQAEQLRKLIDESGMEVFQKFFCRLVAGSAPQIFPSLNRQVSSANNGNYQLLVEQMDAICTNAEQAGKIANAIETANEDIFRDFDLSTFMEHFKLDALEKTILALAFKTGPRPDLKTKANAILSTNFTNLVEILADPITYGHAQLPIHLLTKTIGQYIQERPPSFDDNAHRELAAAIHRRYPEDHSHIPTDLLAALYLWTSLSDRNPLVLYIKERGSTMTADEETCRNHLRVAGNIQRDEEQVAAALIYTTISQTPPFSTSTLVSSLQKEVPRDFNWGKVLSYFDQPQLRITSDQFLDLYEALRPLAVNENLDIQLLFGGKWVNSETQLSFLCAILSLTPDQLDAKTIPALETSFDQSDFGVLEPGLASRASYAVSHPLVSLVALTAIMDVALDTQPASDTYEARRLFQSVIVPNLDIFLVSAFGVPKPWSELAHDTINTLFDRFLYKADPNYDFVLMALWRKDKAWVASRLSDLHARAPLELPTILLHARRHKWLDDLIPILSGFGLDLAAFAHAEDAYSLDKWAESHSTHPEELARALMTFLNIKSQHELDAQRSEDGQRVLVSVMLPVRTISALLHILEDILPKSPVPDLITVQRQCITAYPRLINYGEGYDDIIDNNGLESNSLPIAANEKMEEHYKRMYNQDLQPKQVVEALSIYKHSRSPTDQDVFACMIHGLFDEYALYGTYPLEALATTAVLFGGIIQHKLISDLPLEIGLYMILEAVRDHPIDQSMYKFGLQALIQLYPRLSEWPGFCRQLLQVPGLQGTEAWIKAEQIVRDADQEEASRNGDAHQLMNGSGITNGNIDEILAAEPSAPAFSALHVDPSSLPEYDDPSSDVQEKIQFVLNNVTADNLESKFSELKDSMDDYTQTWFAGHLVEERAKMQPNYHQLYLDLVKLFGRKSLWAEVLRETYVSTIRMLNSEATMQSQTERAHLKNLGVWLGSLTLARDKAIKHKNIAFKQLLIEAYDTQRLIVVIPFVCKVLAQGKFSTIFKPPNPWVMDIIHLLIELYHHAELKLNQRFEIEVLCTELELDHRSIEPSSDIMNRMPLVEEATEVMAPEILDRFDNMSMNGLVGGVGSGRFSPQEIASSIPDLGPLLTYPPVNDMVNQTRLREILKTAMNRSVQEIIAPVVERSVTIAAISTAQMIHKDFATEPDADRLEAAAINMVRKTAGSLALVTSKEPLRASITNHMRTLSADHGQGLPEGTIIMCVNQNLEVACNQVEKKAEDRAVPEIKELIEPELELRRQHKLTNPTDPFIDRDLSRWSWTIPNPYKLQPNVDGLNMQQMAIYEEFARQPRAPLALSLSGTTHVATSSDTTRSVANEVLQDQYAIPNLATPAAEPPVMPHLGNQQLAYAQPNTSMANGRLPIPMDTRSMMERVQKTLLELQRATAEAPEQHFEDLTKRVHEESQPVLKSHDELCDFVIKSQHGPSTEPLDLFIVDQICRLLFSGTQDQLLIETLVSALQNIRRISGRVAGQLALFIGDVEDETLLNIPLVTILIEHNLVQLRRIDSAASKAILGRKEGSLDFLSSLLDYVLLVDRPPALYADFAKSLEVAWQWIEEDPSIEVGQQLKQKLLDHNLPRSIGRSIEDYRADEKLVHRQDQMDYVFDEWVHLCRNPNASEKAAPQFILQMYKGQLINERDGMCLFLRISIDASVKSFEQHMQTSGSLDEAYSTVDSLAKLISLIVSGREREIEGQGAVQPTKAEYLKFVLSLTVLVLNHHHVVRGDNFNQKVFLRLFSTLLCEMNNFDGGLTDVEQRDILFVFAEVFLKVRPSHFPGFIFGWLPLVSHRNFMPQLLRLPDHAGWSRFAKIVENLMLFVGELLKPLHLSTVTKEIYQGVLKFIVVLQHDFPEFVAANHSKLCANIPSHCVQLHNLILDAKPSPYLKSPDPLQPGLKIDRINEIREFPDNENDVEAPLRQSELFEILEQALQTGPSEDAVAHIAHAAQRRNGRQTGPGFVPINVDPKLLDSLVVYTGMHAITRAEQTNGPAYIQASPDAALLSMLVHELNPEARYYFLSSIVDQLRYPNNHTHYFTQALLEIFGTDLNDQEESDIREQIIRILLERLMGQWPQPWGVVLIIQELVKNEKYMFYELPFVKSIPDVSSLGIYLILGF